MELSYTACLRDLDALKRLGKTFVFLDGGDPDLPWGAVTQCEPGSTHRNGLAIDCRFRAEHPSGITFSWSVDIEPRQAVGSQPEIDLERCRAIAAALPPVPRGQFIGHLESLAASMAESASDHEVYAETSRVNAAQMRRVATEVAK